MEDRAGQAASWLHWDLLSHESSLRTQGIHVNQVITRGTRLVEKMAIKFIYRIENNCQTLCLQSNKE